MAKLPPTVGLFLVSLAIALLGVASSASAETYREAVEGTASLAHFWPMGETSGSSFTDVVGSANATVAGGVTLGEPGGLVGDPSTAALFDGSSGTAHADVNLSGTHKLTVEFWMKWSTYGEDDHLALELTPNFNEHPGGFLVDPDASGTERFGVGIGEGASRNTVYFARPSADVWHYYAFVIDTEAPAATEITPYVDGRAVSYTKTASGTGAGAFASSTLFWMSRDASTLFGAGAMQDLALYETTLGASAIATHYELGAGGPQAAFTSTPVAATVGVPVRLDAAGSFSPGGSITDYAWDFDGSKSYGTDGGSSPAISHTFSAPGTYTVDLRVKDSLGETATVSHTITVGTELGRYEQAVEDTASVTHFWPMGEASGSSFADAFGGDNAEALGGVTLGAPGGLVGDAATAAAFDGSSGAARAEVDLSGTHQLTVEFWMKWNAYAEDDHLAMELTPNFNEYPGGFLIDPNASGTEEFGVGIGHGESRNNAYFARPSAAAWHYYAFTFDTTASGATQITPYVDGRAVSYSKSAEGTGAGTFAKAMLYWMSRDASTLFGAGAMQDVALYDTALSASTVGEHYELGEGGAHASFNSLPVQASAGVPVRLDAAGSSSQLGSIADYAWDFDGSKSYATNGGGSATISHTFTKPGTYTVDLRVTDSLGVTGVVSHTITVGPALGQYEQTVELTPGAAHFWPMGESSGSSFADVLDGANAALAGGVALGEPGGLVADPATAAAFNGSSGAADAEVNLSGTHELTVEFWMKWHAYAEDDHLALELTPNFNEYAGGFLVDPDATPGTDFAVSIGEGSSRNTVYFARPSAGAWHYYAFVLDTGAPAETEITPYVDGHAVSYTKTVSGTGAGSFANSTLYWMSRDASTLFGVGSMQDLALYETTLSASAILEHYERGENTYRVANTTAPSIAGTPVDGQTLTASLGAWSGATPITYAYQWQNCNLEGEECEDIAGAMAPTYTLSAGDLESTVRVLVTATNPGGSAQAASAASAEVQAGAPSEQQAPSISGSPSAGETLYAEPGEWGGSETGIAYQWERCNSTGGECADLAGETGSTYKLGEGDVGKTLRVRVGASNALGSLTALSPATEAIGAATTLQNTWAPSIAGTPQRGQTFTADAGSWLGVTMIGYVYQWLRCDRYGYGCEAITGATGATYVPQAEDVGSTLWVRVSATEAGGTVAQTTAATQPIASEGAPRSEEPPATSGTGLVGDALTALAGEWSGEALTYTYQWERCAEAGEGCSAISGATASSYTLTNADAGSSVRVLVTAADGGGSTAAPSPPVTVSAATLLGLSAPSITGEAEFGRTLSADPGIWTGEGLISYAYQWQRCNEKGEACANIAGATESGYTAAAADAGDTLKVAVTASGSAGSGGASSAPTPVVTNQPLAPEEVLEPSIEGTGSPTTGETLHAQPGTWLGSEPLTYTYQWQRCNAVGEACTNISGATGETYLLTEHDLESTIRVVVTASNSIGAASATTYPSEVVVAPGPPASSEGPTIAGTTKQGEKLFVANGRWSGSRPLTYTYSWERCNSAGESCAAIEGATKLSYTVASADVGGSLRVRVTVSNSRGSTGALSAPASMATAAEAKAKEAIEVAEATDPSVLALSTSASIEEETVKPALGDTGVELTADNTLTGATVSKETPGEFAVQTPDGEFNLQPLATASNATTTPTIVNDAAAVFADTATATDTIVRPDALGATALLQLRSAAAPSTFSWEIGLGAGQQLEELPNGSIAVTEPGSSSAISGSLPEEVLEKPKTESTEPSGEEGVSGKAAEEELESSAEESASSGAPPAAPHVATPEVTPKAGELHPQETATQYETATSFLAEAKAHTANRLLMVIEPPRVMDAAGNTVSATLSAAGDTVTMTISPSKTTTFPVTAATAVLGPSSTGGTASFAVRYGLSDSKIESFEKAEEKPEEIVGHFDEHLQGGPLDVKIARDVISYNPTAKEEAELFVWLEAVHKLNLEPYITFGVLNGTNCGFHEEKKCPSGDDPKGGQYAKGIEKVIKKIKNQHEEESKTKKGSEAIPLVKIWGAWNEPDFHSETSYDPLYKHAAKAALLWKEGRAVLARLGCNCTMVAGEFAEYDGYISRYKKAILDHHEYWSGKPHVWGFHDYHDLVHVSKKYPDLTEDASKFVNTMSRGMGHPRIWLSEQGVELNDGHSSTRLAQGEDAGELQRLAAHDFFHLHAVSDLSIEVVDYYQYWGPSLKEEANTKFDSGLLNGQEKELEPQNPREAYCVIALGEPGCPPSTITKATVAGTTTTSASTVLLTVDPGGLATQYHVEYGTTTAYGSTTTASAVANNTGVQSETVALSSLEPCMTYHYQAEAESEANEGKPSLGGDKTFMTRCEVGIFVAGNGSGASEIWEVNGDGSHPHAVGSASETGAPAFSPNASSIAYALNNYPYAPELRVRSLTGSGSTAVYAYAPGDAAIHLPQWSPDGSKLIFELVVYNSGRKCYIDTINANGTGLTTVATNGMEHAFPSFSPDGSKIVYQAAVSGNCEHSEGSEIDVANADGSGDHAVTNPTEIEPDEQPRFSPDGTKIAFSGNLPEPLGLEFNERIYTIDANGGDLTELTHGYEADEEWAFEPEWTPDGSQIVYAYELGTLAKLQKYELYAVNADGSDEGHPFLPPLSGVTESWGMSFAP